MIAATVLGFVDGFSGFFLIYIVCLYSFRLAGKLLGISNTTIKATLALSTFLLCLAALGAVTMYWLDYLSLLNAGATTRRMLGKSWVAGTFIGMVCLALIRRMKPSDGR
jgi:hypothetical protein